MALRRRCVPATMDPLPIACFPNALSRGSARMDGTTCRGRERATRIASGSRKSCCSRRRSRPSFRTSVVSSRAFPTLTALAPGDADDVMAAWAGLGYYSRARNLHRMRAGDRSRSRRAFPRVGAELAAAARHRPVDSGGHRGVCLRRAGRHTGRKRQAGARATLRRRRRPGIGVVERELWAVCRSTASGRDIDAYTQGLMDLGATVCPRSQPHCDALSRCARPAPRAAMSASTELPRRGRRAQRPLKRRDTCPDRRRLRRHPARAACAGRHLGRIAESAGIRSRSLRRGTSRTVERRFALDARSVLQRSAPVRHEFSSLQFHHARRGCCARQQASRHGPTCAGIGGSLPIASRGPRCRRQSVGLLLAPAT